MEWTSSDARNTEWQHEVTNFEEKQRVAAKMVERLGDGDVVGVGSGSTSLVTLHALVDRARISEWRFTAITSSLEMEMLCVELGVVTATLLDQRPDWSFDGADEVDPERNMIKGRGGAMLREKLVMSSSPERFVVVDASKRVARLGEKFAVPLEILPEALNVVKAQLDESLNVRSTELRMAKGKDGPVITEYGNVILDARFEDLDADLAARLNNVPGVVATGLFFGFHPTVISV
jgi:ribose 5-phosphate isomerase A